MNKDLKMKMAFTLAEGATHVGISHNIGGTFHRFVESFTHVDIFHITRRVAFTLAEVLITLGIIGIVSAMTIPTLVKNYQERVLVNKAKQAHALVNNAVKTYWAMNTCYNATCLFVPNKNGRQVAREFMTVFKGAKLCPDLAEDKLEKHCKKIRIKGQLIPGKRNGKYFEADITNRYSRIVLNNGMVINISANSSCHGTYEQLEYDEYGFPTGNSHTTPYNGKCGRIYIDTNGTDEPNQFGRDNFAYDVYFDGRVENRSKTIDGPIKQNKLIYNEYNLDEALPGFEE